MRLYHLTNGLNAQSIVRDQRVTTLADRRARGDDASAFAPVLNAYDKLNDSVVWLTNNLAAKQAWQVADFKHQVRFEVETSAQKWAKFCTEQGIPRWYRQRLEYRGTDADSWYVRQGDVTVDEWRRIELTETRETIWTPGEDLAVALRAIEDFWNQTLAGIEDGSVRATIGG
jgi:hypothetical protein